MLYATLTFYLTKNARLSFSATEAPTRKSGEPTSMRFPRRRHRQNLFRLSTCRTTVVWSMAHTQLSLATTASRFSLDPETLYNYCIRHPLAKYKPKSGCASPEPTKKGFFSSRNSTSSDEFAAQQAAREGLQADAEIASTGSLLSVPHQRASFYSGIDMARAFVARSNDDAANPAWTFCPTRWLR